MAQHKSAKKRIRQTDKKTKLRKSQTSEVRTLVKKLRESITSKEKETANTHLKKVQSLLAKLVKVGNLKTRNASRRISRLACQVNRL